MAVHARPRRRNSSGAGLRSACHRLLTAALPTVYRRWGSKPELIGQTLTGAAGTQLQVPDAGTVDTDLQRWPGRFRWPGLRRRGQRSTTALIVGGLSAPEIAGGHAAVLGRAAWRDQRDRGPCDRTRRAPGGYRSGRVHARDVGTAVLAGSWSPANRSPNGTRTSVPPPRWPPPGPASSGHRLDSAGWSARASGREHWGEISGNTEACRGALHLRRLIAAVIAGKKPRAGRLCELSRIWSGNRSRLALEHDVTPRTY